MATVPQSIDALPLELLQQISSMLRKEDLLKFRLVAPRTVLPFLNALLFENLIVDVDGTDDLPRWVEAEADGVAIKRLQEVSASRISDHVRVLSTFIFELTCNMIDLCTALRLTRPYSLSGYYGRHFLYTQTLVLKVLRKTWCQNVSGGVQQAADAPEATTLPKNLIVLPIRGTCGAHTERRSATTQAPQTSRLRERVIVCSSCSLQGHRSRHDRPPHPA